MNVRVLLAIFVVISCLLTADAATAPAAGPNGLTPAELADGWILLFDGETLFGWRTTNMVPGWEVADGAIAARHGGPGRLTTTSQWGNYVLKLDFRAEKGTTGEVLLRVGAGVKHSADDAYAVAIGARDGRPSGSLIGRKTAAPVAVANAGAWQTLEIAADGPRISVKLDGRQLLDYNDPRPLGRGYIALRLDSGSIAFRNIKLKPLGMKSMFNGRDLAGWKTYPQLQSVCSVNEKGELNIKGGKGQLETADQYDDFTMQLEVCVNGHGINSGIFFRCIPGDVMNGYESQIHNGFKDDDRTQPLDCGTGGIFRRQNARRVVADDLQWFSKTIHADGPHMAVWVNGYQVSDWTDNRKPHKNPRRGLRLEPGTIIIQGHDETTDFSFRNLRISELPER